MKKQLKNKTFTLVVAICLAVLGTVLLLGAFEVEFFSFANDVLQVLTGALIGVYAVFVLWPFVENSTGNMRILALVEFVIGALLAFAQIAAYFVSIPILSDLAVCACIGFLIWLRGLDQVVYTYLCKGTKSGGRSSLARLYVWLALLCFGLWQMAKPSIKDRDFLFCLAFISLAGAVYFAFLTYRARRRR